MGSITGAFKQDKAKQTTDQQAGPFFRNTGYSSVNGRSLTLDPSIRNITDQALGQYAGIYGDLGNTSQKFVSGLDSIRSRYLGNQGAYQQAIVDPVKQAAATNLGRTERNVGMRKIGGSSFGDQAISNAQFQGSREVANAQAIATNEQLQAELGLNQAELDALNNAAMQRAAITGEELNVAKMRIAQELSILGIGSDVQGVTRAKGQSLNLSGTFGSGNTVPLLGT